MIHIDLKRKLGYRGASKNFELVKQKFDAAQPCIKDIYAKHGIQLNFMYKYETSGDVDIYDEYPRNNDKK